MKMNIELNAEDTIARVEGVEENVKSVNEHDHEGHSWLWMELEDGREYVSYDDGETWGDCE